MVRSISKEPTNEGNADIQFVNTEEKIARLTQAARVRLILPEHLARQPSPVRCHVAIVGSEVVGWVRSIAVDRLSWCASLFVEPKFRRRWIGRALVATMLRADHNDGLSASVLIAGRAGAKLYDSMGYQTIGSVLVLNPPRARPLR